VDCWKGSPSPPRQGCGEAVRLPEIFLLFDLKMEHFGAVFKLDLTEETRTQMKEEEAVEEEAIASCLILATQPTPVPPQSTRTRCGAYSTLQTPYLD